MKIFIAGYEKSDPEKGRSLPVCGGGSLADDDKLCPNNFRMRIQADDLLPPLFHPLGLPQEPEEPLRDHVLHVEQAVPAPGTEKIADSPIIQTAAIFLSSNGMSLTSCESKKERLHNLKSE